MFGKFSMVLVAAFAFASPVSPPEPDRPEVSALGGAETDGAELGLDELADPSEPSLAECLWLDETRSYGTKGPFGSKGDDHYAMNGKTITRAELEVSTKLHAGAHISKKDTTEVVVHWWYDAFSGITYHLKVYVEC